MADILSRSTAMAMHSAALVSIYSIRFEQSLHNAEIVVKPRFPFAGEYRRLVRFSFLTIAILFLLAPIPPVRGAERSLPSAPATISADRVSYDEDLGLVVAAGHVEISQEDRVLLADTVTYNQRTDTITASGNVSLHEPTGEIIYADYFELTDALKDGVAQNFRLLMQNNARFASAGARREGGVVTEMAKGVYSPCDLCKEDRERPPLWQVKSARIIHNEEQHEVYFEDATLEMYGVPVFYTPYFSAPDPTVKRRSGFLTPTPGHDTQLGYFSQVPYFWAIDNDKDATIAPIFTTDSGQVFDGQYRQRWGSGRISLEGSITEAPAFDENGIRKSGDQVRGHFNGTGLYNIDENWRTGFDSVRETNDTYFQRYKILYTPQTSVLTSNAFLERFFGRSYNAINAYAFQDIRSQVTIKELPIVTPAGQYNLVSEPGSFGQRWNVDATTYNILRSSGANAQRLSQHSQWELPYTSPYGDNYTLTLSLQTDGYTTESNDNPNNPQSLSGNQTTGRVLPQTKLEWRYPWVRQDDTFQELIEPRAAFIAGPQGRNGFIIPNEDSLDFEFDDQNLFSLNPFPGYDRVDGGERAVYGTTIGAFGGKGGSSTLFVGQEYRFHKTAVFTNVTGDPRNGLQDNLSDYVGRLEIKPTSFLAADYRFRLDHEDLTPRRTEIDAHAGVPLISVGTSYLNTTQNVPGTGNTKVEQISLNASSHFTPHWTFNSGAVRDLVSQKFRNQYFSLTYDDECFTLLSTFTRNFTTNRDIKPSDTIIFQLVFKTLGELRVGGG